MNRYLVTDKDGYKLKLYYPSLEIAQKKWSNAISIEQITDLSHEQYIDNIIAKSCRSYIDYKGRTIYVIPFNNSELHVRFFYDKEDNTYYDYCEYQLYKTNQTIVPITFTMSEPKKVYNMIPDSMEYSIISYRKYGQPKLTKPKELKGIKAKSVDFIPKKCRCSYFIKDGDLYIQHRDYFSPSYCRPEDIGTPLEYRIEKYGINSKKGGKFIYPDCWGDIVLRSEAWIKFTNFVPNVKLVKNNIVTDMCQLICNYHNFTDGLDYFWHSMFETIAKECMCDET